MISIQLCCVRSFQTTLDKCFSGLGVAAAGLPGGASGLTPDSRGGAGG